MSYAGIDAIPLDQLHAERKQIKAEIARDKHIIAESRVRSAKTRERYAGSFDQIARSQNLLRQLWLKGS